MNKFIKKNVLVYKIVFCILGTFLAALGIYLIVSSCLGADAISTFILGILQHCKLKFGTVSLLINGGILILIFIKQRELIGWASILNSFGIGIFLNLLESITWLSTDTLSLRFIYLLLGIELFALGTAIYLSIQAGSGAYECLMIVVNQWIGGSVQFSRIVTDGTFMVLGILLGGPLNIGTVIIVFLLGPSLQLFLKLCTKVWVNEIAQKYS